jgi:chromosomal replication initiation ATPase DnaA
VIEPAAAKAFGVPVGELRAPTRRRAAVAQARQCVMYLAHTVIGASYSAIGEACGRHRRTVAKGCRSVEERRDDPAFDALLARLEAFVLARLRSGDAS